MSDKRYAVIHFNDGTKITIDFPKIGEDFNMGEKLLKLVNNQCLLIEVEGSLMTIPMTSIKYVTSYPAPNVLPDITIKGAVIVD